MLPETPIGTHNDTLAPMQAPGAKDEGTNIDDQSSVQVAIRIRPYLPHESESNCCVHVLSPAPELGCRGDDAMHSPITFSSPLSSTPIRSGGVKRLRSRSRSKSTTPLRSKVRRKSDGGGSTRQQVWCARSVSVDEAGGSTKDFTFDRALPSTSTQADVYEACVQPLLRQCLKGYNATVLAYGQTGSGKTYTMLGQTEGNGSDSETSMDGSLDCGSREGIIPRALRELFRRLEATRKKVNSGGTHDGTGDVNSDGDGGSFEATTRSRSDVDPSGDATKDGARKGHSFQYEVRLQVIELYGEELHDLLSPGESRLVIRDIGRGGGSGVDSRIATEPVVVGASEIRVESSREAALLLRGAIARRVTGPTAMNAESSRSHAIMTVALEQTTVTGHQIMVIEGGTGEDGVDTGRQVKEVEVKRSKFHFVDLAGSERQKRTQTEGTRLKEGIDINKGLLALGNVISALGDPKKCGRTFVPYRDSKLTHLLKGSLGGNHRTLLMACVSPGAADREESMGCLRFANRAKNIQNHPVINVDATSQLVANLREQVRALATEVLWARANPSALSNSRPFSVELLQSLAGQQWEGSLTIEATVADGSGPLSLSHPGGAVEDVAEERKDEGSRASGSQHCREPGSTQTESCRGRHELSISQWAITPSVPCCAPSCTLL